MIQTSSDDRLRIDNDVHEAHLQLNTIRNRMKSADKSGEWYQIWWIILVSVLEKALQLKLSQINQSIGLNYNRQKQLTTTHGDNLKTMQNAAKHMEKDVDLIEKDKRFQVNWLRI